ncbi:uncharacterized protein METZ01_LOCUS109922 [marine metagenome]|uniref:Rap1a immunity protein domain-containing protein n=1 Tax=marine metagenome TaxID=408172 RepID=A0A381WXR4_9ZZZZ|tara:strand:+ start:192 stop:509 length:318 start_codon:yes stop_codon:yes gene_type:complete
MKKFLLLMMIVAFVGSNSANAFTIIGTGVNSCGKFLNERSDHQLNQHYIAWMLGFITALNHEQRIDLKESIDSDGIYYAVKNRCEDEPLDEFWNAIWWVHKNELK